MHHDVAQEPVIHFSQRSGGGQRVSEDMGGFRTRKRKGIFFFSIEYIILAKKRFS